MIKPRLPFFILFSVLFAFDQWTKNWAETILQKKFSIEIISGFLDFTYVRNTGVAFGIGTGINEWWAVIAVIFLSVGYWLVRDLDWKNMKINLIAAMILSGAIGNLTDRIRYGYVIDFIDVYVKGYHWPAFNIADSAITLSVVFILWIQIKNWKI